MRGPIPLVGWAELRDRLDAALARAGGGVVALDADGTIWSGDVGEDVFETMLAERSVRPEAIEPLAELGARAGVPTAGDATARAAALYEAWQGGRLPDDDVCVAMALALAGWREDEVRALAARVLGAENLDGRLHAETVAVLAWARAAGVEEWVVSASPAIVVREAAVRAGVPAERVVGLDLHRDGDVLVPPLEEPATLGEGKARRIDACARGRTVLGALGDNGYDVELLRRAVLPVAVRPKPALRARAGEVPGLVELAADRGGR